MAKNFRFHQSSDVVDWSASNAYGKQAIEGITDPTGANASREITSIPSPFARIDLARAAFDKVAHSSLDANTAYHKIVSDSLDVAEIFFNIDNLDSLFEIIHWDAKADLNILLSSSIDEHRLLGETLQTYLLQDAASYNFNKLNCLYMLKYKAGGPDPINIVGGTSPASLFFSSANNLGYVNVRFGNDKVFDSQYAPLYTRDFEFVKFFFALSKSIPNFANQFIAVDDYLRATRERLTPQQRSEVDNLTAADYTSKFSQLSISSSKGHLVEILGYPLKKKKLNAANIAQVSDFVIAPLRGVQSETPPLVLPNSGFNSQLTYTTHSWPSDGSIKVPYHDELPITQRRLPGGGELYPYLTVSDILEPYLIETIYPIDGEKFFTGNHKGFAPTDNGYLLPLKKELFNHFSASEIQGYVNGELFIEIEKITAGAVKVTVKVPIKCGRNITFDRIYYTQINETKCAEIDLLRNKGAIIKQTFSVAVYPFLKVEQGSNFYRVAMIDRDIQPHNRVNKYNLQFNNSQLGNKSVKVDAVQARSQKSDVKLNINSDYYVLSDGFDYIELQNSFASGIIVPKLQVVSKGATQFSFAVDFGTTNTHIEYKTGNNIAKQLDITVSDSQIGTLHDIRHFEGLDTHKILHRIIEQELIPMEVGDNGSSIGAYRFPVRTAITHNKKLNFNQSTYAMADLNMSFIYEKVRLFDNQSILTNLKWSNYTLELSGERKIKAYFENILFLIRNKILLNGGDLDATKFAWFYPSSMSKGRRNKLEGLWGDLYKEYITQSTDNKPLAISESVAPFYFYKNQKGVVASHSSVVSIDIGGGTTDVVIFERNCPRYQTSIRYAANSIFGDGYGCSPAINGFVQKYLHQIADLLLANKGMAGELYDILNEIKQSERSEDIIAFFFSIENNSKVKENKLPISFNEMLRSDDNMRAIFLVFYSSLIFHVAKLMKAKGVDAPNDITFSGTGSKILSIIDPSTSLNSLSELTSLIFKKVLGVDTVNIKLHPNDNPKEVTCKGGLLMIQHDQEILNEVKNEVFVASSIGGVELETLTYRTIEGASDAVIADFEEFVELFAQCHKTLNFNENFTTTPSSMNIVTDVLLCKAKQHLSTGIQDKQKEIGNDTDVAIDESPFFYILNGGLNNLAYEVFKLK